MARQADGVGVLQTVGGRLAGDAVVYGLGGTAQQLILILLAPVYAHLLGPSGVGVIGVLQATTALSLVVVGLAWPQAFLRWYLRERVEDRGAVIGTTLVIRAALSIFGLAVVAPACALLAALLYGGDHIAAFSLIGPIVVIDAFVLVALTHLRAERRPWTYLAVSTLRGVLAASFIVALLLAGAGVLGVAAGQLGGVAVAAAIGVVLLTRASPRPVTFDRQLAQEMLRFAAPLVPAAAGIWALHLIDRPLLQALTGSAEAVGVYTLGYAGGLLVNATVVGPFAIAWGAAHWSIDPAAAPQRYRRTMTQYVAIACGVAVAVSCLGTDAIRAVAGAPFEQSRFIVPFCAFAYVLYGLHHLASTGLNVAARTHLFSVGVAAGASVAIASTIVLVPVMGIYGAALATVAGFLTLALATGRLSQRYVAVRWPLAHVTLAVSTGALLSAAALLGPDSPVWRLACAVAYGPVAILLLSRDE